MKNEDKMPILISLIIVFVVIGMSEEEITNTYAEGKAKALQGLLDLYNKEKERNIELATTIDALKTDYQEEKEKNKKAIEYINKNCSTNNCDFMDDGVGNLFKDILELLEERN